MDCLSALAIVWQNIPGAELAVGSASHLPDLGHSPLARLDS